MVRPPEDPQKMRGYRANRIPKGAAIPAWAPAGTVYRRVIGVVPKPGVNGYVLVALDDFTSGVYPAGYTIYAYPPGHSPDHGPDRAAVFVGPHEVPTNVQLAQPGAVIQRWTEEAPARRLYAPLPCHEDHCLVVPGATESRLVQCRKCGLLYRLTLLDESDGGYLAQFVTEPEMVLISRKRIVR